MTFLKILTDLSEEWEEFIGMVNKKIYMLNLVTEDTREGEVFSKLFDKLEEIRQALRKDKVFDIIADIFYGENLYQCQSLMQYRCEVN